MAHVLGLHPGTIWYRSDLQNHTPRDNHWVGAELHGASLQETEAKRAEWAKGFVDHCIAADPALGIIGITDHHDYCIGVHVQRAAGDSGALLVYPGVEVTCSDNAQCIVLFDPSASPELPRRLIAALTAVPPLDLTSAKGPNAPHAGITVAQLASKIEGDDHLRGACLLLPHFSDGGAHKSLNTPSTSPRFAALNSEAVYIEKPFSELEQATVDKIRGDIPEWGNRRRAVVATGDNRNDNFGRVGLHPCWIKLGEPTLEALRQAFLADEARIDYGVPSIPSERIVEMEVRSSLTGDEPLRISFNPGFTALVGGRGTGKSALLEYLRFGLGRTESDIPRGGDEPSSKSREDELIEDTLADGYVAIVLEREGVRERWERKLATRDYISVVDQHNSETRLTLDAARERFRARAFRQKGLSSLTADQAKAFDQITGIAAAEELAKRREIDRAVGNARRAVTTALQQLVSHWQAKLELKQAQDRVADLNERLTAVNSLLAQGGMSTEHLAVIEKTRVYARANAYLETASDLIGYDQTQFENDTHLAKIELSESLLTEEFDHLQLFQREVEAARSRIRAAIEDVQKTLRELQGKHEAVLARQEAANVAFAGVMLDAQAAERGRQSLIDDSSRLAQDLSSAEQVAAKAIAKEQETTVHGPAFVRAKQELEELLTSRRDVLQRAAEQVAGKSSGLLKARLGRDLRPEQYVTALQRLTEGSHITDAGQKCSTWVASEIAADPGAWERIVAEFMAIYELKIAAGSPVEPGSELTSRISALLFGDVTITERQASKVYQNLNDSTLGQIVSAVPQDRIVMTYVDESGKEMPFGRASPGQQASALLELLLRQSAGTLIIDQPEDDLDNRVIMKIVSLIRTSKAHRQLVFTTHNPNILVNGDADKVIALRTREAGPGGVVEGPTVSLTVDGAIETSAIREYITNLIEGGKAAFDLRGRKYGYATST